MLLGMCRNIRPLFNFDPPATDEEIFAASVQFVRKVSGFTKPSQQNVRVFDRAVLEIMKSAKRMIEELDTDAPPKNRDVEAEKRRVRALVRFPERAAGTKRAQGATKRRAAQSKNAE
jgi:hypothetical protein